MAVMTDYFENKLIDFLYRAQAFTAPTIMAYALIVATRGYSSNIRSAVVALNDTVVPTTPNGRYYKCTTAGTAASGEPTWPTTAGGTVADGTVTWTEQTTSLEAGTFTEVANAGGYTRPTLNPSATNYAATQGGTTTPSSGTSGTTNNLAAIAYGSPSANWGLIFGIMILDSATYGAGNALTYSALITPKQVNNGDAAPSFAISAFTYQIDN